MWAAQKQKQQVKTANYYIRNQVMVGGLRKAVPMFIKNLQVDFSESFKRVVS